MRNLAANLLSILLILGLVALGGLELARHELSSPGPAAEPIAFTVDKGARMSDVAERLEQAGAIDRAWLFRLSARYGGKDDDLKFGEYEFPAGASMEQILALVTTGGNVQYQVTVPEGRTVSDVIRILEDADFLTGEITEIPPEGSLLPETYSVSRGESRQAVLERMQQAMSAVLDEAWEARAPDLPIDSKEDLLVLASIVEKETTPGEHRRVASVFVNRLRKGMRLQSDPTIIYGITLGQGPLGRGIRQSEIDARTPYNTYQIDGLPPTPITNPGRVTVMATANPDDTPYIYFVADGTGGHAFAETLNEHNRNVAQWRRIERERAAAAASQPAAQAAPGNATEEPAASPEQTGEGAAQPSEEPGPTEEPGQPDNAAAEPAGDAARQ